jgi:hypothetical protein
MKEPNYLTINLIFDCLFKVDLFYKALFSLLLLQTSFALAQDQVYHLIDQKTREPVPYANIAVIGKTIGTSSDQKGSFSLPKGCEPTDQLKISAVGFEELSLSVTDLKSTIGLKEALYELPEVKVRPGVENKVYRVGGKFNEDISCYWRCGKEPFIIAKYFEKPVETREYPFLDGIYFFAKVRKRPVSISIRICLPDSSGKPGTPLHQSPLVFQLKKGRSERFISLRELHLKIPAAGCFIGIEWLLLPENRVTEIATLSGTNEKIVHVSYEPNIGVMAGEPATTIGFRYSKGAWMDMAPLPSQLEALTRYVKGQSAVPAIQLQLGN